MKQKKYPTDKELDTIIDSLSQSARSPQKGFSAAESYKQFANRIPSSPKKRLPLTRYISVAASVILLIFLGTTLLYKTSSTQEIILTTADNTQEFILPDGTRGTLSRYSTLKYPETFKGNTRDVTLSGEAYFEVFKSQTTHFIVHTNEVQIKVLGTHFNVNAYAANPYVKTTLLEGSVAVSNPYTDETLILKPSESATFLKENKQLVHQFTTEAESEIAWREGKLIFNHQTLAEMTTYLSNYFNTHIEIKDENLKNYKLTARFENKETLEEILNLLAIAADFSWIDNSKTIIITPKSIQ